MTAMFFNGHLAERVDKDLLAEGDKTHQTGVSWSLPLNTACDWQARCLVCGLLLEGKWHRVEFLQGISPPTQTLAGIEFSH